MARHVQAPNPKSKASSTGSNKDDGEENEVFRLLRKTLEDKTTEANRDKVSDDYDPQQNQRQQ